MKRFLWPWTILVLVLTGSLGVFSYFYFKSKNGKKNGRPPETEVFINYTYKVVNSFPHDSEAFTQGLFFEDGYLYESTGLKKKSSLRKVDLETGEILQIYRLEDKYFGEGIASFGDRIVQLTWQSKRGFVYDKDSFDLEVRFDYPTEGWGITYDGAHLIMSDGSAKLYFLDPETLTGAGEVEVKDDAGPVKNLNELEYIDGKIYANVWLTDYIVIIDPRDGKVNGRVNLEGLLDDEECEEGCDVLNGIAYDEKGDRMFVTGKLWPKVFEIELVEQE